MVSLAPLTIFFASSIAEVLEFHSPGIYQLRYFIFIDHRPFAFCTTGCKFLHEIIFIEVLYAFHLSNHNTAKFQPLQGK